MLIESLIHQISNEIIKIDSNRQIIFTSRSKSINSLFELKWTDSTPNKNSKQKILCFILFVNSKIKQIQNSKPDDQNDWQYNDHQIFTHNEMKFGICAEILYVLATHKHQIQKQFYLLIFGCITLFGIANFSTYSTNVNDRQVIGRVSIIILPILIYFSFLMKNLTFSEIRKITDIKAIEMMKVTKKEAIEFLKKKNKIDDIDGIFSNKMLTHVNSFFCTLNRIESLESEKSID